jgi:hypothetical protein
MLHALVRTAVANWKRALGAEGREFESHRPDHLFNGSASFGAGPFRISGLRRDARTGRAAQRQILFVAGALVGKTPHTPTPTAVTAR